MVLENVRQQVAPKKTALVAEIRAHPNDRLASYLEESGRGIEDILRTDRSWTTLCRDVGKLGEQRGPRETELVKRIKALAHVDDRRRAEAYRKSLAGGAVEQTLADMLFYSLFPNGGGFPNAAAGLDVLRGEAVAEEMRQVVDIAFDAARRSTYALGAIVPELADVPLEVHATYSREEILAGLGWVSEKRKPGNWVAGVAWCENSNADALLITLKKSDSDYSPTTMYRDFALSPELFHWESQSFTASTSPTGQRYINHRGRGSHVLLFVREAKKNALGEGVPYIFLGPADYVAHEGDRPMAITWRLHRPMPAEVYLGSRAAVA